MRRASPGTVCIAVGFFAKETPHNWQLCGVHRMQLRHSGTALRPPPLRLPSVQVGEYLRVDLLRVLPEAALQVQGHILPGDQQPQAHQLIQLVG